MSTIARFVTHPHGGGFCEIDLESGQRIVVSHQKMSTREDWLAIDMSKFMGFSVERIFVCNLDSTEGKGVMARLVREVAPDNVLATPLGAFVAYVKDCWSVDEVQEKCRVLLTRAEPGR